MLLPQPEPTEEARAIREGPKRMTQSSPSQRALMLPQTLATFHISPGTFPSAARINNRQHDFHYGNATVFSIVLSLVNLHTCKMMHTSETLMYTSLSINYNSLYSSVPYNAWEYNREMATQVGS